MESLDHNELISFTSWEEVYYYFKIKHLIFHYSFSASLHWITNDSSAVVVHERGWEKAINLSPCINIHFLWSWSQWIFLWWCAISIDIYRNLAPHTVLWWYDISIVTRYHKCRSLTKSTNWSGIKFKVAISQLSISSWIFLCKIHLYLTAWKACQKSQLV